MIGLLPVLRFLGHRRRPRTAPVRHTTPLEAVPALVELADTTPTGQEPQRAPQPRPDEPPPWLVAWDDYYRKRAVRLIEPRKSPGTEKAA